MRAHLAALPLLAVLSATCAPVFAQSTPPAIQAIPAARTVTYGEVQNMRSLGVKIRFPDCKDKCERDLIDASVTPEQFMRADSLDFVGERLLKIPDFVYAMKNLKFISLKNSLITEEELINLGQSTKIEILDIQDSTIKSKITASNENAAKIMISTTGTMSNLRSLNIWNVKILFNDTNATNNFAHQDFLDQKVADQLIYLKVYVGDYSKLAYYKFLALETLSGNARAGFAKEYDDAFALPSLKVLEGFEDNSNLIRARVKKRQQGTPAAEKKT